MDTAYKRGVAFGSEVPLKSKIFALSVIPVGMYLLAIKISNIRYIGIFCVSINVSFFYDHSGRILSLWLDRTLNYKARSTRDPATARN